MLRYKSLPEADEAVPELDPDDALDTEPLTGAVRHDPEAEEKEREVTDVITLCPFVKPVRASDKQYYESSALREWMDEKRRNGHPLTSPLTREILGAQLKPAPEKKAEVAKFFRWKRERDLRALQRKQEHELDLLFERHSRRCQVQQRAMALLLPDADKKLLDGLSQIKRKNFGFVADLLRGAEKFAALSVKLTRLSLSTILANAPECNRQSVAAKSCYVASRLTSVNAALIHGAAEMRDGLLKLEDREFMEKVRALEESREDEDDELLATPLHPWALVARCLRWLRRIRRWYRNLWRRCKADSLYMPSAGKLERVRDLMVLARHKSIVVAINELATSRDQSAGLEAAFDWLPELEAASQEFTCQVGASV